MAKKVLNIISTIILILLIVLVVAMFIMRASGDSLSIFGIRFYRVASYSMEPTLKKDDVIIVKKTAIEDIEKGDIITYRANQGEMAGQPITHRVVLKPEQRNDRWILQTQGDAEGAPLDAKITGSQVIGKYVMTIPLLGYFYSFFLTPVGLISIVVVILGLFGYEMISLIVSYRSLDKVSEEYLQKYAENEKDEEKANNSTKEK